MTSRRDFSCSWNSQQKKLKLQRAHTRGPLELTPTCLAWLPPLQEFIRVFHHTVKTMKRSRHGEERKISYIDSEMNIFWSRRGEKKCWSQNRFVACKQFIGERDDHVELLLWRDFSFFACYNEPMAHCGWTWDVWLRKSTHRWSPILESDRNTSVTMWKCAKNSLVETVVDSLLAGVGESNDDDSKLY